MRGRPGDAGAGWEAAIIGAAQTPYRRHPDDSVTTAAVLAEAVEAAVRDSGVPRDEIDGLAVASFTLGPDRAVDLAWKLGLRLRFLAEAPLGLGLVHQAQRAVEAGDARAVVVVGGDRMDSARFRSMSDQYNAATRDLLVPIGVAGPNAQFSLLTAEHRRRHRLDRRPYGRVVMHQRERAATHRNGLFGDPLTMEGYLAAPAVTSELGLFDCVPLVTGASAVVVGRRGDASGPPVAMLAFDARYNVDDQEGDGLRLGLDGIAASIRERSGIDRHEVDIVCLYDDYPVIVLRQLEELGYLDDAGLAAMSQSGYPPGTPVVNPSGGLLCCGQAGAGGTLHGLLDAVEQLRGRAGPGQVPGARTALVTNYGMVLYRYGACASALLLRSIA